MDYFLVSFGVLLLVIGLVGCIVPVIPGPPLSFGGLLLGYFSRWGGFDTDILLWLGIAAAVATIFDYILPIWATKKFGGSKRGVWGATIGLLLGIIFFPPFGIIIGPFIGAFIGEYTSATNRSNALPAAIGSLIGFLLGTGMKFAAAGVISYYFVVEVFIR
jgi:uncharacterized protein